MCFRISGDERLKACATERCGGAPSWRLEADGVGSNYCSGCKSKIDDGGRPMCDFTDRGDCAAKIDAACICAQPAYQRAGS